MKAPNEPAATTSPVFSPSFPAPQASRPIGVLIVDDDDDFRDSLELHMVDEGFSVTSCPGGPAALDHLATAALPDVILLDWRMPGMNGLDVLSELRRRGIRTPVILLTGLTDNVYEDAALAAGAVDFVDKSRRWPILVRRIELITAGARTTGDPREEQAPDAIRLGPLELRFDINRVRWADRTVDLTLSEFRIVARLASRPGEDVGFQEIYGQLHGKASSPDAGAENLRLNVRNFIKRIRKKFRDVDPAFDQIRSYSGFGYGWVVS